MSRFLRLALVSSVLLLVCLSLVEAQQIRIPLKRVTLPPDSHPTKSAMALSRQLSSAPSALHHSVNLAIDPSRRVSLTNYFDRMYT